MRRLFPCQHAQVPPLARGVVAACALALLIGAVAAPQRTFASLLLAGYGLLGIGVAGAWLLALRDATKARWCDAAGRVARAMTATLLPGAVLVAIVLVIHPSLYPWHGGLGGHGVSAFKAAWLSRPFFILRAALYLLLWLLGAASLQRAEERSRLLGLEQDVRVNRGAAWLVVYTVTIMFAGFDWIMSLTPHWYSTMFGLYCFMGAMVSGLAVAVLAGGQRAFTIQDRQDLGTLLMGTAGFWMYIWFSQYMLIWYANLPEEAVYFVQRQQGAWLPLFVTGFVLHGALPFVLLLPREAKRSAVALSRVAAIVLVGRWLDLFLLIAPAVMGARPAIGAWEIAAAVGATVVAVQRIRVGLRQ